MEIILQGEEIESLISEGLDKIHNECPSNHVTIDIKETCDPENLHRSSFVVELTSLP